MFVVKIHHPDRLKEALKQAAFAGGMCYQPSVHEAMVAATKLPVKKALFDTGHHTTLQHGDATVSFILDNVPVNMFTFGLHYTHPHYNTSQRSGRYCTTMFGSDQEDRRRYNLEHHIMRYFTLVDEIDMNEAMEDVGDWVEDGIQFFNRELPGITELAKSAIRKERPNFRGNLDLQATMVAQEQLRNVISTSVPTGALYTVNLSTLFSMYLTAWNQPLADLLEEMLQQLVGVCDHYQPYVSQLQLWAKHTRIDYVVPLSKTPSDPTLVEQPEFLSHGLPNGAGSITRSFAAYNRINKGVPFNLVPFSPIAYETGPTMTAMLEMSAATFGQYQRHRTIKRSNVEVTKRFYVPPLLRNETTREFLDEYHRRYWYLSGKYGHQNMMAFAPYGVMVNMKAEAYAQAWYHSIKKRVCLNAQEEIWHMEKNLIDMAFDTPIHRPGPPCLTGKCPEGKRYCGRDLKQPVNRELI